MVTDNPQTIINDIVQISKKLFELYTSHFPELIPTEFLQYVHGLEQFKKLMVNPLENSLHWIELQPQFTREYIIILENFNAKLLTFNCCEILKTDSNPDKRFCHDVWQENPLFSLLKDTYQHFEKYILKWLSQLKYLDQKTKDQLHFYFTHWLNRFSPTNYPFSNPEVIQSIINSGGQNLLRGFKNLLEDLLENGGYLNIRMTDKKAFKLGVNLAITPGKVVYQNDLMQLIQYSACTDTVYKVPILFVPPWINKYYVLDLSPENSLVKWLTEQGFTVFMISWVNPGKELAEKDFADYMQEGPIDAIEYITKNVADCKTIHTVGYCIGGTLLACTLAYLAQKNDKRTISASFFMSLLNFSYPGEIGVFLDDMQIDVLEKLMKQYGYLDGRLLDMAFSALRPNELIWPYFINNYLLGNQSKPFDLLFWNADSSNLAYKMYIFYLRNMYLHNLLKKPGGIILKDVPLDLNNIKIPSFFLASESDHITLWRAVYSGLHLLGGSVDFILTESGHVRGVINPPSIYKYNFKTNNKYNVSKHFSAKPGEWLRDAASHQGSWWPYWTKWLIQHNDEQVPARSVAKSQIIEDAPGSYVLQKRF